MGLFWVEISDPKSAAPLLTRYYSIQNLWGISNDILCMFIAQGAAKLPEVKVESLKKRWKMWLSTQEQEDEI